jgi:hypothetical protein
MDATSQHIIRTVRSWVVMLCVVSGKTNEIEVLMKGERGGKVKKDCFQT